MNFFARAFHAKFGNFVISDGEMFNLLHHHGDNMLDLMPESIENRLRFYPFFCVRIEIDLFALVHEYFNMS